jgi:LuxR family transcriptional regulator, maltose regulon positive regulatory protein
MTDGRAAASRPVGWSGGLLATKLVVPLPRWRPVGRPRLLDLLEGGARRPLTLLAAPPGSGKTVLLALWVASGRAPGPVAWVTVDPGDDDPTRFWAHVLAALRESGAASPDGPLAGLDPPPKEGVERFLALLINRLAELPTPVVLVLDDLHEAAGPGVPAGLRFLLRHGPPQLRLVVATRADPPLSLHRLRVAGRLGEIRAAELAFTPVEAGELLAGLGVDLPDGELEALWKRTEGWVAGLRLAALSLDGHPDPGRFVAEFAGDDRAVAGYLVEEVLARQEPAVQAFLLRTCVADRLCGGLADALTGRDDGDRLLARLERDHAFTVGLGPGRSWYRYHPLFAELLRAELRHGRPDEVPELHLRAASWHAANGMVPEAVHHALAGGDLDGAARLLATHWFAMLVDGKQATLRELLGRLPVERVRTDPELSAVAAVVRLALGELAQADAWPGPEGTAAPPPGRRRPRAEAARSLAVLLRARLHGDVDGALSAGRELLAPPGDGWDQVAGEVDRRAMVLCLLGAAALWGARLDDAAVHLQEGRELAECGGREHLALGASSHLAMLEAVRGRLGRAAELGRAAAEAARRHGWAGPQLACAEVALALVAYQRDDLAGAFDAAERATRAASGAGDRPVALAAALVQAWLAASGGPQDAVRGLAQLRAALGEAGGWPPPRLLAAAVRPAEARLLLAAGDQAAAAALVAGGGRRMAAVPPGAAGRTAAEALLLARLQLVRGDPVAAAATVAPLLGGLVPGGWPATPVEAWLRAAVAHRRLAEHGAAARSLERALDLAASEGYRRAFVEGGPPVRALLADHLHRDTMHGALAKELLEGLLTQPTRPTAPPGAAGADLALPAPVETLSEREQVVLRYLPSMLSAGEIAAELFVSVNTVKTHIKSIYRKLDANRRWDAVRRARQLHLL